MVIARICVYDTFAKALKWTAVPAGLVGGKILIEYADPLWDGLTKTVVFKGNDIRDVITNDAEVVVPWETIANPGGRLQVGFYGTNADKKIIVPTFYTDLGPILDGTDPSGDESADPTLPVWAQLEARVKKIEDEGGGGGSGGGGGNVNITINGEGPDEHGNFIINALNDVEIAQLDATLIGGTK